MSGEKSVEPFIEVSEESAEWSAVESFLRPIFHGAESLEVDKLTEMGHADFLKDSGRPVEDETRERMGMDLKLRRVTANETGRVFYSFTASKTYRGRRYTKDFSCDEHSVLQGLLERSGEAQFEIPEKRFFMTNCTGKANVARVPLGSLAHPGRIAFMVYEHYYESEAYLVLEYDGHKLRTVVETPGGGGC